MPDAFVQAAFYLSPALHEWWRWEDDAQVLAWQDGRTIAFTAEVTQVIDRLAPEGLPPFAAVALLLAACQDDWEKSEGRADIIRWCGRVANAAGDVNLSPANLLQVVGGMLASRIKETFDGLDSIAKLPKPLRSSVAAKALLAETVFEGSYDRGTPEQGRRIAEAMKNGLSPDLLRPQLRESDRLTDLSRQLTHMAAGLARVDAGALARRLQTGLEESVQPPQKELSPPEKVRQLLAALRNDEKLGGLAKLAHDLMAAVAVPRALRLREELQLGGVSDLTNRGPLDRLLVSELAQDDLTLAVRVAVNEAMYLRRESPPKEPPHHRAILIDAGVRMWGVPRVFATAVALALSAMADPAAALKVFRAAGDTATPVDLTSREGLTLHLSALETAAHPGEALPAFLAAAMSEAGGTDRDGSTDCFVVTHADAATDPDFTAAIAKLGLPSIYVGAVDRDGSFHLAARTRGGQKPIRQAKLSLDEVLVGRPKAPPPVAVPLVNESAKRDELPAIFLADSFPFFLPYMVDPERAMTSSRHGLVTITDDGRLLWWAGKGRGAQQMVTNLPRGQIRLLHISDDLAQVTALFSQGREQAARLLVAEFGGQSYVLTLKLEDPPPVAAFQRGMLVFVICKSRIDAFDTRNGDRVASTTLVAGIEHHRGRYFRVGGRWVVVAYDGSSTLKFENLPAQSVPASAVFDRQGREGSWLLAPGKVADQSLTTQFPLPTHLPPHRLRDVSPDGGLLLFDSASAAEQKAYLYDLAAGGKVESIRITDWPARRLGPQLQYAQLQPVNLRKKFRSIGVTGTGELALSSSRSSVALRATPDGIHLPGIPPNATLMAIALFGQFHTKKTRIKLRGARWTDGSRAWLDNRGLLHLRSSDASIPEMSFTLPDSSTYPVAGWTTAGDLTGSSYFIGERQQISSEDFRNLLRQFTARLRA